MNCVKRCFNINIDYFRFSTINMEVWGEDKVPWPVALFAAFMDKYDDVTEYISKSKL